MKTIVSKSTIMIVFALLMIAAVLYINPQYNKQVHQRFEDRLEDLDRRLTTDLVGHKNYVIKQDQKVAKNSEAADNEINESLVNVLEEIRLINSTNKRHQDHLMTLFTNIDSVITTVDKVIWSQIDLNNHIEQRFDDIAQWPALLEGQINKLAETQYIAVDSLWSFLKINGTRKMKKTLNP